MIDGEGIVTNLWDGLVAVLANGVSSSPLLPSSGIAVFGSRGQDAMLSIQSYLPSEQLLPLAHYRSTMASAFELLDPHSCRGSPYVQPGQLPQSVYTVWSIGRYLVFRHGAEWVGVSPPIDLTPPKEFKVDGETGIQRLAAVSGNTMAMTKGAQIGIGPLGRVSNTVKRIDTDNPGAASESLEGCFRAVA